jgi:hypothetical protein
MNKSLVGVLATQAAALAVIGLVALDLRAHKRVEMLGGVNVRGYRGPVMNDKRPNELRIAVFGGDLAFGWGVASAETLPMFVRRLVTLDLDRPGGAVRRVTAVNLGAQGLPPAEYASWIERFAYLHPDVICIVPDPEAHQLRAGKFLPDRHSLAFTRFGYSPILPLTVQEKGALTHSRLLRGAGAMLARVDDALSPAVQAPSHNFAAAMDAAAGAAARVAPMGVVVVLPPDSRPAATPLRALDRRLREVSLAALPDMRGDELKLDRFHLSVAGHSRAADAVAPAVLELIHIAEGTAR